MSEAKITFDFVSSFLNIDKKAAKKAEKDKNAIGEDSDPVGFKAPSFNEKLFKTLHTDTGHNKEKEEPNKKEALLTGKDQSTLEFLAKNPNKTKVSATDKLNETNKMLDEILAQVKAQN